MRRPLLTLCGLLSLCGVPEAEAQRQRTIHLMPPDNAQVIVESSLDLIPLILYSRYQEDLKIVAHHPRPIKEQDYRSMMLKDPKERAGHPPLAEDPVTFLGSRYSANLLTIFSINVLYDEETKQNQDRARSAAAGFFITPDGFILTAYHTIDQALTTNWVQKEKLVGLSYSAGIDPTQRVHSIEVLAVFPGQDLALCKAKEPIYYNDISIPHIRQNPLSTGEKIIGMYREYPDETNAPLVDIQTFHNASYAHPHRGIVRRLYREETPHYLVIDGILTKQGMENVFCWGYAGNLSNFQNTGNSIKVSALPLHGENISFENEHYENLVRATLKALPGNSGSPIFDLDFSLIGLTVGIDPINKKKNKFTNHSYHHHPSSIHSLLHSYQRVSGGKVQQ